MLIPCVDCGKRAYTEESPLWYHCNKCLTKTYCQFCGNETKKTILCTDCNKIKILHDHFYETMHYCDGCGEDYPNSHLTYVDMWDGYFCESCQE